MNTDFRVFLSARIREERERLGLSQGDMAALGGTKMRTYQDWERGLATVSTEFLAQVSVHGVDVSYVLTGARIAPASLSSEEAALLDNYNHADEEGRAAARRVLSSLAKSCKAA